MLDHLSWRRPRADPNSAEVAVDHLGKGRRQVPTGVVIIMAERLYTTPITSQLVDQRLEHQVTDEAVAAGRHSHRYQALCGQLFIAAPMVAPPGRPCPACASILAKASQPAAVPQPRQRRQRLLRRLLRPGQPRVP